MMEAFSVHLRLKHSKKVHKRSLDTTNKRPGGKSYRIIPGRGQFRYNILNSLFESLKKNKFIIIGNLLILSQVKSAPFRYDSFGFSPKPKYTIYSYKD